MRKFFYLVSSLLLFLGAFVYLSPSFVTPNFISPLRVDSLFVKFHSSQLEKEVPNLSDSDLQVNLYNPSSLDIPYENFDVLSSDSLKLRGWFVAAADTPANTVLIIHDLNSSKISCLDQIKQLRDRGFNVCILDLRAHGNSEGAEFTPGLPAVRDEKIILDKLLIRPGTNHIALMGIGIGAAIAMQVAAFDGRCDILVLQNPFFNLDNYLKGYAQQKWGVLKTLWYPVLRRKTESLLQYPIENLDLNQMAGTIKIPTLLIAGDADELAPATDVLSIYNSSVAEQKALILIDKNGNVFIDGTETESYYNRIAEFINISIPRKSNSSRFKKFALNDHEGIHRPDF